MNLSKKCRQKRNYRSVSYLLERLVCSLPLLICIMIGVSAGRIWLVIAARLCTRGHLNRRENYDRRGHKSWNDSPGNMVDSLRHQCTGPASQTDVDDFGRACDHRGNFAFDRPIIAD